ncbi:MAG: PhnD/SsuA/transferrin family substrate-binding protein [Duganella sp.]
MTWHAALPMYNVSPRLQQGYETLLSALLGAAGVRAALAHPDSLLDFWRRPDMLVSQTCGYPYVTQLRGQVQLIATPAYDFAGCEGSDYSSVLVARADSGVACLADARGKVAAVNDRHSNSGMHALRRAVAPLAGGERFFAGVAWSGSHAASVAMVREGGADIAAIDCVTYGYLASEYPARLDGLVAIGYSARAPGLPFVAGRLAPPELVARLRDALLAPGARLRQAMQALRIASFEHLDDAAYDRIDAQPHAHGWVPELA